MMQWLPYIGFSIYIVLCTFAFIRFYKKANLWLSITTYISILFPIVLFLISFFSQLSLTYPKLVLYWFIGGNALFIFLLVLTHRDSLKGKILGVLSALFSAACCVIVYISATIFEDRILLKQNLQDNLYLYYGYEDNGMHFSYITSENILFIDRKIASGIGSDGVPEKVKFISLIDSLLNYSYSYEGKSKNVTINLKFDHISNLINGVRLVTLKRKSGAIDSKGKIIIPIGKYESLSDNYNNLMLAKKDGKWGYINKEDKVVIPFKFDGGGNFLSDSTTVEIGKKYYYINKKGQITSEQKNY